MDGIDCRDVLRTFFAVLSPLAWAQACCRAPAEAMPLAMQKDLGKKADDFTHEAASRGYPGRRLGPFARHPRRSSSAASPLGLLVAPRTSPLWMAMAVTSH